MAFYEKDEICDAYTEASDEAAIWRIDYPEFERLADNGLMASLEDENLPEVNDGSLAASLWKLSKHVIRKKMSGRAIALDDDDQWKTELANIIWEKKILKNARMQATPRRKWKDAVRKAAIYGGQPIVNLFVENGRYTGSDFIIAPAQDVKLEAKKVSDLDSKIIFWDGYYNKVDIRSMIEQAEEENKQAAIDKKVWKERKALDPDFDEDEPEPYNKWDVEALQEILDANPENNRPGNEEHSGRTENGVSSGGIHLTIAFQRGVNAPFYMFHHATKKFVREWSNPDPTGDVPVHYLYCYQDFINPYGTGIVKLAGGTQNVIDYLCKLDIKATALGIEPPLDVNGDADSADLDSFVWAQRALWFSGNAKVSAIEPNGNTYQMLPEHMGMHQARLQKMIPSGEGSVGADASGDPSISKVPASIKMQQENMSVDYEDFAENADETYALVGASMINTHFANMQGSDLMKLDGEEQEVLAAAGIEFPVDELGNASTELEIIWDEARATFDFEVDPDADKTTDEEAALEGKLKVYEMLAGDPMIDQYLQMGGKRINRGELLTDIISQLSNNDKIIEDISPEEVAEQQAMQGQVDEMGNPLQPEVDPATGQPMAPVEGEVMPEEAVDPEQVEAEQFAVNMEAIMAEHQVPENVAAAMLDAEQQGLEDEDIEALKQQLLADMGQEALVNV